tara:strand:- start:10110 stop:11375 length:1266 start_codon:yes stop_codon:yes gene_type:complete
MPPSQFFEFSSYHIAVTFIGFIIILASWLPRIFSKREPAAAPLMIIFGATAALLFPDFPSLPDPRRNPLPWELVSELAVIIALFGAGLRIDKLKPWSRWFPTLRLLCIAMPLTILAIAFAGTIITGLTVAGAILLGAVLSPTDPVLAGDVQVGPPQEGAEHPVRFTLTTEATLNDGLAFPFVYLGLVVAAQGFNPGAWFVEWMVWDVFYRIIVGVIAGSLGGRALGYLLFTVPKGALLADTGTGVVAFASVILCYGSTEIVEGYGFIAVAVMGLTLRRIEEHHPFHRRLHDFSVAIEHTITALLLVALGTVIPALFIDLSWNHILLALILIIVVRPLSAWVSLGGSSLDRKSRAIVSVYGVRGIGSIYYLCYAGSHMEFANETQIWSLVALVILLSTIMHGFTVGWAMDTLGADDGNSNGG